MAEGYTQQIIPVLVEQFCSSLRPLYSSIATMVQRPQHLLDVVVASWLFLGSLFPRGEKLPS